VLAGVWVGLNAFLVFDPWRPGIQWLTLSPEAWALVLVIALLAWRGIPWGLRAALPLVGLLVFLRLFRFADLLVPVYFNRPFNLYLDVGYLPSLLHFLGRAVHRPQLALIAAGVLGLAAAGLWVLARSLGAAHGALEHPRARRGLAAATAVLLLLAAGRQAGWGPLERLPAPAAIAPRLAAEAVFCLRVAEIRREGLAAVDMAAAREPQGPAPLARLQGRDVHLLVVESYGQVLFSDPRLREPFAAAAEKFREALAREGFHVASAFLRSPTFGGGSWLAFGTLETGVWLPDQLRYNYLLGSRVRPLAEYFNRAGYRSVSVMPGTTMPWPEGAYFAYRQTYYARDLAYRGPPFAWSPMPDQFALHRILAAEILPRQQPLFIRYVLTSTHAPFNRLPPYLEDWSLLGDGAVFHRLEPRTFPVNWPDLQGAAEAYLAAVAYELQVLEGFLARAVRGEALVVVVGDHQPVVHRAGVQPPWLVPVHLISRDRGLLAPFEELGYRPGMLPDPAPPPKGMDAFLGDFLAALGG
jgi:hypothetical protein